MIRVNALVQREISAILRTRFTSEALALTITGVDVANDLRQAYVYYAVLGDEQQRRSGAHFFKKNAKEIRYQLGRRIVLKYLPFLQFMEDKAIQRGNAVHTVLDHLNEEEMALARL